MACSKAEEDPYLCQPCSIERTALLHLCPVEGCEYETDRKSDLTRHSRTHDPAQPKPLACPVEGCAYETDNKSNLTRHSPDLLG